MLFSNPKLENITLTNIAFFYIPKIRFLCIRFHKSVLNIHIHINVSNVVLEVDDNKFKIVEFMNCKSLRNVFQKYYNTRNLRVWLQIFFLELGGGPRRKSV